MDPLSIAASTVQLASFCGTVVKGVHRFVLETREAPDTITEFYETIRTLHISLLNINEVVKRRPRQLPFEKEHHRNIFQILRSCKGALQRLKDHLPELPDNVGSFDKVRLTLSLRLKEETIKQTVNHINSYSQVLQLSLITLSLGAMWETERSQDQIQAEIRNLTDSIRSSNLVQLQPEASIPSTGNSDPNSELVREIRDWQATADDIAAAVSLWEPDQASLNARSLGTTDVSDSGIDMGTSLGEIEVEDVDPEPDYQDLPSREILQYQFEQNQKTVEQLVRCGIFLKAASYQRQGIDWKNQLWEAHRVPFPSDEQSNMKESLAETLLGSETIDGVVEARDILNTLLKDEVALPPDQRDEHRRCRLYHKLGRLYMDQGNVKVARRYLNRAFEGRRGMTPIMEDEVLDSCNLLIKALQLDQAFVEARALINWRDEKLVPPPTTTTISSIPIPSSPPEDTNGLTTAFAWCKERNFDVDSPDFCFDTCDPFRGTSPLHLVVLEENLEVFHQIVDHVVNFEQRDAENFATPLLLAAGTRNRETTSTLLERGAKVDVCDRLGMYPLHRCQSPKGGVQVAEMLLRHAPSAPNPAVRSNGTNIIINLPDKAGKSALYLACDKGNTRMARFLLERGASADLTDNYDKTALYRACEKGDEGIVRCLLEHGANTNIQGPGSCTPLLVVIEAQIKISVKMGIVKMLLDHGADPLISDATGQNAFAAAKKAGFGSDIKRLLQQVDPRRSSVISSISFGSGSSGSGSVSEGSRPRKDSSLSRTSGSRR